MDEERPTRMVGGRSREEHGVAPSGSAAVGAGHSLESGCSGEEGIKNAGRDGQAFILSGRERIIPRVAVVRYIGSVGSHD